MNVCVNVGGSVMFYLVDKSRGNGKTVVSGVVRELSFLKRYLKYFHKDSGLRAGNLTENIFFSLNILRVQI